MGLAADDPRIGRIAFAKLQGDGFEYFVRKYEVLLGRKSKSTELDIVLGDNMNISRQHAKITYNFDLGVFELTVMGKNGVTVNGVLHTPSSASQQLYTQDFLQVGEQKFYFLLPKGVSRRRPPSASPPMTMPEHVAPSMSADQAALAQTEAPQVAQLPPAQAAPEGTSQPDNHLESSGAAQNGTVSLHSQGATDQAMMHHHPGLHVPSNVFHRPVAEVSQLPYLAPP